MNDRADSVNLHYAVIEALRTERSSGMHGDSLVWRTVVARSHCRTQHRRARFRLSRRGHSEHRELMAAGRQLGAGREGVVN